MMTKEQRKELENAIVTSLDVLLSRHNPAAAEKVKKHVKEAGKTIAKKFFKAVNKQAGTTPKTGVPLKKEVLKAEPVKAAAPAKKTGQAAAKKTKTAVKKTGK